MKILFIYPNILLSNRIPKGLAYLSGCLKREGHQVYLFDTTFFRLGGKNFEKYTIESDDSVRAKTLQVKDSHISLLNIDDHPDDIEEKFTTMLDDVSPDLVGMTCNQNTYPLGIEILRIAKRKGYRTIVGGVKATTSPLEVISEKSVDMICIGEGEVPIVDLCNRLENNKDITDIKNLWIKENGDIHRNGMGSPTDLDMLPAPDWSIFDRRHLIRPMGGKVYTMGFFELSRGCPFACTYCINRTLLDIYKDKGKFLRLHKIEKIISEIKHLKEEYGLNYITYNDDLFLDMPAARVKYFCELYKKNIALPFYMETRPETIREDKIKMLVDAGLNCISMGIESGSPFIREEVLNRRISNELMVKAFLTVKKTGVRVTTNNIIGIPFETRENIFETIEINRKIKVTSATVKFLYPYQGTKIYEICKEKGYIRDDIEVSGYQMGSILKLPQITSEELEGLHRTFQLYCFLPKIFFPIIRIAERRDLLGQIVFSILSVLFKAIRIGKK